jgi:spermidine synthase
MNAAEPAWYHETLYPELGQRFRIDKVIFEEKSEFQHVVIFENAVLGRVLALDGVIQVTQRDEFVYHEMMTHVPLISHQNPQDILIIGGGDGGILREVLRHPVRRAVMVEIDPTVVDMCAKYMPSISAGAFDNKKGEVIFADGCRYVKENKDKFDVIIVDSTDPQGPGEVLFTEEFYRDCAAALNPGGIMVTQNGVPFFQADELKGSIAKFRKLFQYGSCYVATIPTYYGGFMAMGWAAKDGTTGTITQTRRNAWQALGLTTQYYNLDVHQGAFALPEFIRGIVV